MPYTPAVNVGTHNTQHASHMCSAPQRQSRAPPERTPQQSHGATHLSEEVDESALAEAVGDGRVERQRGVSRREELDPFLRHPRRHQVHLMKCILFETATIARRQRQEQQTQQGDTCEGERMGGANTCGFPLRLFFPCPKRSSGVTIPAGKPSKI